MAFKHPVSVLVVIYSTASGRVLMLQRKDDPDFWQSVTGSLEPGEEPVKAAIREVREETGIRIDGRSRILTDRCYQIDYEIFPQYRSRYAPGITHNREHWFTLALAEEASIVLTEHLALRWLPWPKAAALTKSWSNRQAIETLFGAK